MIRSGWRARLVAVLLLSLVPTAPALAELDASRAARFAQSAEGLFRVGNIEQALVEFRLAYEADPNDDYLFNIAQCEYQLGQLKEALDHYRQYLGANGRLSGKEARAKADAMELARMRIDAINQRKSVFTINCVPVGADVRITGPTRVTGVAPNDFRVPRGRYQVTVSKPNYATQAVEIELGIAETKSLFFKLDPIPGRLEIRTLPPSAALYVRGNRTQNPYVQQVEPGNYEVYAEATNYKPHREVLSVSAGQQLTVDLTLPYVQRSGRPELIGFWTAAGAIAGGTGVAALFEGKKGSTATPVSGTLVGAGAIAGGIGGLLLSTTLVPDYIRDNLALFRIGAMSIGAMEGIGVGLTLAGGGSFSAGWTGGVLGLGTGALAAIWLDDRAPNYGRVAVIESGAAIGALAGAVAVTAISTKPDGTDKQKDYLERYTPLGVLIGLNAGLGAGLALAYLPDQRQYGPTWRRVGLIDLATAAGAFAGVVALPVKNCLSDGGGDCSSSFGTSQLTARFALGGAAVGLAAGWVLTRNLDRNHVAPSERAAVSYLPLPSAIAVQSREGGATVVPGLAARGRF